MFWSARAFRKDHKARENVSESALSELDVLASAPRPAISVETVLEDGFRLSDGLTYRGSILLVNGQAFAWKIRDTLSIKNGVLDIKQESLGLLGVIWPRPELLVVGTGQTSILLSKQVKEYFTHLGLQFDLNSTVRDNILLD